MLFEFAATYCFHVQSEIILSHSSTRLHGVTFQNPQYFLYSGDTSNISSTKLVSNPLITCYGTKRCTHLLHPNTRYTVPHPRRTHLILTMKTEALWHSETLEPSTRLRSIITLAHNKLFALIKPYSQQIGSSPQ